MTTSPDSARSASTANRGLSTLAVHAGEARQKMGDAMTDAIFCTSTYTFADTAAVLRFLDKEDIREEYGRYGNPSEKVVERKLAILEGGEEALLVSSGMAAVAALGTALLSGGDEVVMFDECYHRSREFLVKYLGRYGVKTHLVPACDYEAMAAAIGPATRLLISESPTNPHLSVVDLERFADIGRRHRVTTLIDATLATPYNVRPLEYGIDLVLHSATKYLGGHNDVIAGAIIGRNELIQPIRDLRGVAGPIVSPHAVFLLQRGIKTFELRMERHNANGQAVAEFLESHRRIERVYYPGLASHPQHDIARRTMRGFGGLVTFEVKDADWRQVSRIVDAVTIPRIGPSLGGVESLIEQPRLMSFSKASDEQRAAWGIRDNMVRLACGIENTEDLVADLAQALER